MRSWLCIFLLFCAILGSSQSYKIVTYNIRLSLASDSANAWENRKDNVASMLQFYEPDIFGIQEGLPEQVDYLDENLKSYAYLGVGRDDGARKGEFSAIYFNENRVKLIEGHTFWLSLTPDYPSKGWDAALPRICTYGLFEDVNTENQFWVFNTHFDHIGETARLESVKLILHKMAKINEKKLPAILMGDLNLTPDQEPIKELFRNMNDSRTASKTTPYGPIGTWNGFNFNATLDRRIDYIAVNEKITVNKYAVLTDSANQNYLSDHLPVFVEVFF
ncbi:MAG: endonuclease/exonuclease/phosphatase family metal-dependent hydrolase [Cyclobacteriaceae bacterium]|jgi:endonuclease/exonuclease/phosphatase family metal-dependent hydrolase